MSTERSRRERETEFSGQEELRHSAGGRRDGRAHSLRGNNMVTVDLRRMVSTRHLYIMVGISLVMPILILVMTTMMDGTVSVDPQTGVETTVEGFDNAWEIIGTKSGISLFGGDSAAASSGMGLTTMCNINLVYFLAIVLAGIFISEDFRSGFAKNLFAVRTRKRDYVNSKILVCSLAGVLMVLAFFIGSMVGGKIAGLPFTMDGFNAFNILMCMAAKVCLVPVFVSIGVAVSCLAKANVWIDVFGSLMAGMLLFMTISMMTSINATVLHAVMCLAGSALLGIGGGILGAGFLRKQDLV